MNISLKWLNEYLAPGTLSAEAAEDVLTNVGFPLESVTPLADGDAVLDVEVTSNRGDCLSHVGLAREIAAATGRRLKFPASPELGSGPGACAGLVTLDNRVIASGLCPRFTLRVIRGVKVGPSPAWMVRALEAVGKRSINNVVDVTNFVAGELGQPTHAFDLRKLAPGAGSSRPVQVIVRTAERGEKLTLLDGKEVELREGDVVVADSARAISLAGIMGGRETEVGADTVDVLLEAATWAPGAVRRTSRRLGLRTDASHRYERWVDPRSIDVAARRAAGLIAELAGGTIVDGVVASGAELPPRAPIILRASRCRALLGASVSSADMQRVLRAHEVDVSVESVSGDEGGDRRDSPGQRGDDGAIDRVTLRCVPPAWRPDLTREIDLIEEVARTHGLERIPVHERVGVRVRGPQASEAAMRAIGDALTGLGFYEAVTFSFVSRKASAAFLTPGTRTLEVVDERRKHEPVLRPSILASLLACRRANQDRGVSGDGGPEGAGIRLFETSSVFWQEDRGGQSAHREGARLALLADAAGVPGLTAATTHERRQLAIRLLRGALERVALSVAGDKARVWLEPVGSDGAAGGSVPAAFDATGVGLVRLAPRGADPGGRVIGVCGLIAPATLAAHDLRTPVVAAEVDLDPLLALWPASASVRMLPSFPDIERDLSLIVSEREPWERIERLVWSAEPALLESVEFVGVYRGPQAGEGRKSVTLRLRFRDQARTLRREEVDPQVNAIVELAKRELGAQVRT